MEHSDHIESESDVAPLQSMSTPTVSPASVAVELSPITQSQPDAQPDSQPTAQPDSQPSAAPEITTEAVSSDVVEVCTEQQLARQATLERQQQLVNKILRRLNDPEAVNDPVRLQAHLRYLMANAQHVPLDLMRDVVCFQVECGSMAAAPAALDAARDSDLELLRVLIEHFNADLTYVDPENGQSMLHWAAFVKNADMMRFICSRPEGRGLANVLTTDKAQNVMHFAALAGDLACAVIAFEIGADIHRPDSSGLQPVHYAAQAGQTVVLDYLITKGADIEARDNKMRTPLHWSVYGKHVLASQWLLRNGANQGALDAEQCLPLHWAALKGAVNVMVHMMDSGGRQYLSARDCTGATPAQLALQKNFRAIHDYLETERAHYISTWRSIVEYLACMRMETGKERFFVYPFWIVAILVLSCFHYCYWLWPFFTNLLALHIVEMILIAIVSVSWVMAAFGDAGAIELPESVVASREKKVAQSKSVESKPDALAPGIQDQTVAPLSPITHVALRQPMSANELEWAYDDLLAAGKEYLICVTCRVVKGPRVKHCRHCDRCVFRMDHHCPWINNCVGANNHRSFLVMVTTMPIAILIHTVMTIIYLCTKGPLSVSAGSEWISFILVLDSLFAITFTMVLAVNHHKQAMENMTTNEIQNSWRYGYLMNSEALFFNPYDGGAWTNFLRFWGCEPAPAARELVSTGKLRLLPPTSQELDRNRAAMTKVLQEYAEHERTHICGVFDYPEWCIRDHGHAHGADGKCEQPAAGAATEATAAPTPTPVAAPIAAAGHGHSHGQGQPCNHAH